MSIRPRIKPKYRLSEGYSLPRNLLELNYPITKPSTEFIDEAFKKIMKIVDKEENEHE